MNENWFDESKKKFDYFIKNSTVAELKQALSNASFEIYNKIKVPVLDLHDDPNSFVYEYKDSCLPSSHLEIQRFRKIKKADSYAFKFAA